MKAFIPLMTVFAIFFSIISCALLKPKSAEQYFDTARHYQAENDFDQADRYLTKAIEKKPDYYDAYYRRAEVNRQRDSLVRAIADYTFILNMPDLTVQRKAEILNLRGSTYRANLQDDLACADWNVACEQFGLTGSCSNKRNYCKK